MEDGTTALFFVAILFVIYIVNKTRAAMLRAHKDRLRDSGEGIATISFDERARLVQHA
jgi:hypothetical protein